jgi:O-succinylbenzoate synthase
LTQRRDPNSVAAGAVVGLVHSDDAPALATLLAEAEGLVGAGFTRLKVKIAPGDDLSALSELRRAFPDLGLQADANGSYSLEDPGHLEALRALDELDLLCVEQPLDPDDLEAHARLALELDTPVCLDESVSSLGRLRDAIALQACDLICIKPARLGGVLQAVAAHDMCTAAGIGVWCGGMLETALARSANAAIATLPGFCLPGDLSGGERFVEKDPFLAGSGPEVPREPQAIVAVHRGPGVGPAPDQQALDLVTTRTHWAPLR